MQTYDLELSKVIERIKQEGSKLVCIQLPDGLKPRAKEIQEAIEGNTDAKTIIWMGSCFGACDVPVQVQRLGVDLLVQWGHSIWRGSWH
ncbi:diphthamide synthesis protein [Candidatus Woesearchaeota archaeon]|nr:diphthamide synthesis protein [Candidatus Woesearchaeota archaeon]MBI2130596.1 diphthamide synthesis protein [Candidatus Woesearchaeota archaeon]